MGIIKPLMFAHKAAAYEELLPPGGRLEEVIRLKALAESNRPGDQQKLTTRR